MNGHLLLHQLLEEYGIFCHSSIDESVSEYVVEAVAEDTLDWQEKREFVRDIILELSSLEDTLQVQFVEDLTHAARQLLQFQACRESESCTLDAYPALATPSAASAISNNGDASGVPASQEETHMENEFVKRSCVIDSEAAYSGSGSISTGRHRKGREKQNTVVFKNGRQVTPPSTLLSTQDGVNSSSSRSSGIGSSLPEQPPSPRSITLSPLRKMLDKYLSATEAEGLHEDVVSCVYEVCRDTLTSVEDKTEALFAYLPDLRVKGGSAGGKERDAERALIARQVVGAALHVSKLQQTSKKDECPQELEPSVPSPSPCAGDSPPPPSPLPPELQELATMLPQLPPSLISFVHQVKCLHDTAHTVQVLLESDSEEAVRELEQEHRSYEEKRKALQAEEDIRAAAEVQRLKAGIFERFGETEMSPEEQTRAASRSGLVQPERSAGRGRKGERDHGIFNRVTKNSAGSDKVRYRDGVVASYKGEKMIMVKDPRDDYDGGSRGTIKTKGKRGPGFIKT